MRTLRSTLLPLSRVSVALLGLLISSACDRHPDLTYTLRLHPDSLGSGLVTVTVVGRPEAFKSGAFVGFAAPQILAPEHVGLVTADGDSVPGRVLLRPLDTTENSLPVVQIQWDPTRSGVARLTYDVRLGKREGSEHLGYTGRTFGNVGQEFAYFTGRQVFLLPAVRSKGLSIRVRFELPDTTSIVTPWALRPDGFMPGYQGKNADESLITGGVLIGASRHATVRSGTTSIRVSAPTSVPQSEVDSLGALIAGAANSVAALFGRPLPQQYQIIAVPESPLGDDLQGEGWANTQSRTMIPITGARLRSVVADLLGIYLRFGPTRSELANPREYWVVEGITSLYSHRISSQLMVPPPPPGASGFRLDYLRTRHVSASAEALPESVFDPDPDAHRAAVEVRAPFVLEELDAQLQARSSSRHTLDEVVRKAFHGRRGGRFWSAVPRIRGFDLEAFSRTYVERDSTHVSQSIQPLQPTRSSPDGPAEAAIDSLEVVVSGNTGGYLENCGCKVNQAGGVARRESVLRSLAPGAQRLVLDAGNGFVRMRPTQVIDEFSRLEQGLYLSMYDRHDYVALGVGDNELSQGPSAFDDHRARIRTPYVCANLMRGTAPMLQPELRTRRGRLPIRLIGLYEAPKTLKLPRGLSRSLSEVTVRPPLGALRERMDADSQFRGITVVMGRISPELARDIAREFPSVQLIVSNVSQSASVPWHSVGDPLPGSDTSGFVGSTLVLYTQLGEYALSTARLRVGPTLRAVSADRRDVWLNDDIPDAPGVRTLLASFYDRVGRLAMAEPIPTTTYEFPGANAPHAFAGAKACMPCHDAEYTQWMNTDHATAFKTLLDAHRNYQPRCVSCHVVGFGTPGGFKMVGQTPGMANVQCESCHGPGAAHAAAPQRTNIRREVSAAVCLGCHTPDHSDNFDYDGSVHMVRHVE